VKDKGRYYLTEEIGRGCTGITYKAIDMQCDKEVAIKILHAKAQPSNVNSFTNYVELIVNRSSRHIARCLGGGAYGGGFFCPLSEEDLQQKKYKEDKQRYDAASREWYRKYPGDGAHPLTVENHHRSQPVAPDLPGRTGLLGQLFRFQGDDSHIMCREFPEYLEPEKDRGYYIVTEFTNEGNLLNLIGRLSIDDSIEYTKHILAGLHAAHSSGLLHNNLKPENVLLNKGNAQIIDFSRFVMSDGILERREYAYAASGRYEANVIKKHRYMGRRCHLLSIDNGQAPF
jgi:serine/threonine protein kinase